MTNIILMLLEKLSMLLGASLHALSGFITILLWFGMLLGGFAMALVIGLVVVGMIFKALGTIFNALRGVFNAFRGV